MRLLEKGDLFLKRLSQTRHLKAATFAVAFLEATITPFLPEAFVAIVLAYRKDISWKILSLFSAFGSACGSITIYFVGATLYQSYGQTIVSFLHGEGLAEKAKVLFAGNAFFTQFVVSFTPLPDRIFSFFAGAFLVSPFLIFTASFLGRFARILPIAYLSYEYGDEARAYIKKHTRLATGIFSILIALYLAYTYFT